MVQLELMKCCLACAPVEAKQMQFQIYATNTTNAKHKKLYMAFNFDLL